MSRICHMHRLGQSGLRQPAGLEGLFQFRPLYKSPDKQPPRTVQVIRSPVLRVTSTLVMISFTMMELGNRGHTRRCNNCRLLLSASSFHIILQCQVETTQLSAACSCDMRAVICGYLVSLTVGHALKVRIILTGIATGHSCPPVAPDSYNRNTWARDADTVER